MKTEKVKIKNWTTLEESKKSVKTLSIPDLLSNSEGKKGEKELHGTYDNFVMMVDNRSKVEVAAKGGG